jgi:hypothetical protein
MVGPTVFVRRAPIQVAVGLAVFIGLVGCSSPSVAPRPTSAARATATAAATAADIPTAALLSGIHFSTGGWKTNFANARILLSEIESGGPPRDGIPPVDQPKFVSLADASAWLQDQKPVIAFELNGDACAYPSRS